MFVAEGGDQIVASAYLKPNYGGRTAHVANAGFMVDPACTGRGVGRRLAAHVIDEARRDGYRSMVFNAVVETNLTVVLWRSLGFAVVGTIPRGVRPSRPRAGRAARHAPQPVGTAGSACCSPQAVTALCPG